MFRCAQFKRRIPEHKYFFFLHSHEFLGHHSMIFIQVLIIKVILLVPKQICKCALYTCIVEKISLYEGVL